MYTRYVTSIQSIISITLFKHRKCASCCSSALTLFMYGQILWRSARVLLADDFVIM